MFHVENIFSMWNFLNVNNIFFVDLFLCYFYCIFFINLCYYVDYFNLYLGKFFFYVDVLFCKKKLFLSLRALRLVFTKNHKFLRFNTKIITNVFKSFINFNIGCDFRHCETCKIKKTTRFMSEFV